MGGLLDGTTAIVTNADAQLGLGAVFDDVASVVVFFASGLARSVSGQSLWIGGVPTDTSL